MDTIEELEDRHSKMVEVLAKNPDEVMATITPNRLDMLHAAVGISGEAGELIDAIKKVVFYNKIPNIDNIIEELGDLEFYMELLRKTAGISRAETLAANMAKLAVRYADFKYTDQRAADRADKKEVL